MFKSASSSEISTREVKYFLLSSIIVTLLLFYLDEGFYSFHWMTEGIEGWTVFAFYIGVLVICQLFIGLLVKLIYPKKWISIVVPIIGLILCLCYMLKIFS